MLCTCVHVHVYTLQSCCVHEFSLRCIKMQGAFSLKKDFCFPVSGDVMEREITELRKVIEVRHYCTSKFLFTAFLFSWTMLCTRITFLNSTIMCTCTLVLCNISGHCAVAEEDRRRSLQMWAARPLSPNHAGNMRQRLELASISIVQFTKISSHHISMEWICF